MFTTVLLAIYVAWALISLIKIGFAFSFLAGSILAWIFLIINDKKWGTFAVIFFSIKALIFIALFIMIAIQTTCDLSLFFRISCIVSFFLLGNGIALILFDEPDLSKQEKQTLLV